MLPVRDVAWAEGHWSERQLQQRMEALVAFTLPARARDWRRQVMQRFGVVANRLEPRPAGRQLEQQREQLPVCQPQQQHPGQPEQQQRVPRGSAPSST